MRLNDQELLDMSGGFSIAGLFGIAAAVIFTIGAVDGYARPLKCN